MVKFWAAVVVLGVWGLVLEGVALFGIDGMTQEAFIQRFAVAQGGLAALAALPLGYWFSKASGEPHARHFWLLVLVALFFLAIPATVFLVAPADWKGPAAWKVLVLLLPNLVTVATFFFAPTSGPGDAAIARRG
jgi:hypothetical protein